MIYPEIVFAEFRPLYHINNWAVLLGSSFATGAASCDATEEIFLQEGEVCEFVRRRRLASCQDSFLSG